MRIVDPILEQKVNELKRRLPRVEIDGTGFYVAEGDLPLTEAELADYVPHAANVQPPNLPVGAGGQGLVGVVENGALVHWPRGFVLTYCVLRSTFGGDERYAAVRDHMRAAARAWEETCGVRIRYAEAHDDAGDRPADVTFAVRAYELAGIVALSFFPNAPPERRRLLLDPSYFASGLRFDRAGILRHELGHILGFRHEHIRSGAPPVCERESLAATIDLTRYDPRSVMHYFCGGVGTWELAITDVDRAGAQQVYGPPLARRDER
jgi:hypothetical protein